MDVFLSRCKRVLWASRNMALRSVLIRAYSKHCRHCETCLEPLERLAVKLWMFHFNCDEKEFSPKFVDLLKFLGVKKGVAEYLLHHRAGIERMRAEYERTRVGERPPTRYSPSGLPLSPFCTKAELQGCIQDCLDRRACLDRNIALIGYNNAGPCKSFSHAGLVFERVWRDVIEVWCRADGSWERAYPETQDLT